MAEKSTTHGIFLAPTDRPTDRFLITKAAPTARLRSLVFRLAPPLRRVFSILFFLLFVLPGAALATCWGDAAARYHVDPLLLKAIAWQESRGWTGAVGPVLPKGNRALGLMQINTVHMPLLAKRGIRKEDLFDPCVSQHVGAWVLADCIQKFGATWKAVGCYNTGPNSDDLDAQARYAEAVKRHYAGYLAQERHQSTVLAAAAPAPTP